jgi:phage protein U
MMRGPVMATAPTPSQLLTLGMFVFGMDTLAYSDLQRRITWRHEASDRFGARPAVQFIGPGDDDVTIAGPAFPRSRAATARSIPSPAWATRAMPGR